MRECMLVRHESIYDSWVYGLFRNQHDKHVDDVHVDLAVDLLKAMYAKERDGEALAHDGRIERWLTTVLDDARKDLCQLLSRLYIPDNPTELPLLLLHMLLSDLDEVSIQLSLTTSHF